MEETHMGWKLVKGVRQDLVNLFKTFSNANSVRYEEFCKVWKELNFSLIFSNRVLFNELLEFTEEILQITKEYLVSVYQFQIRVAALYTLYGLYFKQPIKGAAKIRLTKSEWEEVQSLIANCKAAKHYDVVFIHLKLYLSGAYNFVVAGRPAGLEYGFKKYSEKKTNTLTKSQDVNLLYRPLMSERLVDSLIQLESLYCKKKSELLGKKNLIFIDGTFAKSLKEELKTYSTPPSNISDSNSSENGSQPEEETENTGTVRVGIKNKSYKSAKAANSDNEEKKQENHLKRKGRHLQLLAKKKAEYYIKKLKEENSQGEGSSSHASLDLLELDKT